MEMAKRFEEQSGAATAAPAIRMRVTFLPRISARSRLDDARVALPDFELVDINITMYACRRSFSFQPIEYAARCHSGAASFHFRLAFIFTGKFPPRHRQPRYCAKPRHYCLIAA